MKISIFTTLKSPNRRGDAWREALNCYEELSDEVIVVDGDGHYQREIAFFAPTKVKTVDFMWPQEFEWPFIGEQFQRGYEACTGDVVIHADLDFLFHEKDFDVIRSACEEMVWGDSIGLCFSKYQFILPDRYNVKSRLVLAVNKATYKDRIRFDSGNDLTQPSLDGKCIKIDDVKQVVAPIYNYEKILKTKSQIMEDQGRMERAYFRHFGRYQMGSDGTNESAYERWLETQRGKLNKPHKKIPLRDHPKYIQETIKNLKPEQWGYNGFGFIEGRVYA